MGGRGTSLQGQMGAISALRATTSPGINGDEEEVLPTAHGHGHGHGHAGGAGRGRRQSISGMSRPLPYFLFFMRIMDDGLTTLFS